MSFGVSFADPTLYGWVDQSHTGRETTTQAGAKSTTNSWGASQGGTSALGVKGDEDLGDGLKASYLIELGIDTNSPLAHKVENSDSAVAINRQSYVGLEGAFGSIKIGRQYTPSFYAFAAVDPSGISGFDGYLYMNGYQKSNGFYYNSPNLSGFTAVLGAHEGGNADTSRGNSTTFGATYVNGALYTSFTQETTTKGVGCVGLNCSTINTDPTDTATNNVFGSLAKGELTLRTFAATYDLGIAKVGVINENFDSSSDSGSAKTTHVSVAVPLGAFTVGAIVGTGSYTTAGSTTSIDMNSTGITADYALSKHTKIYFRAGETNDKTTTAAQTAKATSTVIGLFHAF